MCSDCIAFVESMAEIRAALLRLDDPMEDTLHTIACVLWAAGFLNEFCPTTGEFIS